MRLCHCVVFTTVLSKNRLFRLRRNEKHTVTQREACAHRAPARANGPFTAVADAETGDTAAHKRRKRIAIRICLDNPSSPKQAFKQPRDPWWLRLSLVVYVELQRDQTKPRAQSKVLYSRRIQGATLSLVR